MRGLVPGETCGGEGLPDCYTSADGVPDHIVTVQVCGCLGLGVGVQLLS